MRETPKYHIYLVVSHCQNEECANPVISWTIFPNTPHRDILTSGIEAHCTNCGQKTPIRNHNVAHISEVLLQSGKGWTLRTWNNTDSPTK
jgi:hypothetical protein